MNKYLVNIYIPLLEEKFDVMIASSKRVKDVIYYVSSIVSNLTENEFNELSNTNKYLKKNNWGTPTTLFMLGDKVIDVIGGYVEKDSIDNFFKDRVVMGE